MRISISTRYALCSLRRHLRRTILAILGIGLGSAVCLFMIAFVRGEGKMMLKAAAESGAGHLRVVPAAWPQTRENDLRLVDWQRIRTLLETTEGIAVVTPHARTEGLLAFGTRAAGVEILGVDPNTEQATNRLVRNVVEGQLSHCRRQLGDDRRWPDSGRAPWTSSWTIHSWSPSPTADGEMSSAMLRIVGIVETGSRDLDGTICHVNLRDVEQLTGRAGAADLTALMDDPKGLERMVGDLDSRCQDDGMRS